MRFCTRMTRDDNGKLHIVDISLVEDDHEPAPDALGFHVLGPINTITVERVYDNPIDSLVKYYHSMPMGSRYRKTSYGWEPANAWTV